MTTTKLAHTVGPHWWVHKGRDYYTAIRAGVDRYTVSRRSEAILAIQTQVGYERASVEGGDND